MRLLPLALALALVTSVPVAGADKVLKEKVESGGFTRTYFLYVPDSVQADRPAPLIVLLHGSGRSGSVLVDHWKQLAKKEGIVLAGPDAADAREWNPFADPPELIRDIVDRVASRHPIDRTRVYLFGHSAGAIYGLMLALLESEYFAAAAVHAGALPADTYSYGDAAVRKVPLAIWVGTNDRFFPVSFVQATRDALARRGLAVQVTEIPGHTHDYYGRSSEVNLAAWGFLKGHALPGPPVFKTYQFTK